MICIRKQCFSLDIIGLLILEWVIVDSYRSHLFTWELNKIRKKNGVFVSFSDVILYLYRSNLVHKGVMYNSLTGGLIGGLGVC